MRRVMEKGNWTLFSPSDVPDLHDLFGQAFEKAYVAYEQKAERGEIKPSKTVPATDLWRKMLSMLFETGHPWITFKDACNVRSPQQHVGVVHSSNLCTEITLNTSDTETAVCNLGSVNLRQHLKDGANGKVLETYSDNATQVADAQSVRLVNDVLSDAAARAPLMGGSQNLTVFPGYDVALKTGTSRNTWNAAAMNGRLGMVNGSDDPIYIST